MNAKISYHQSITIEEYLPLVNIIVNQLHIKESSTVDRDDLISIGVLGLLDAAGKYNPKKNASFETYARHRIRGSIMDELRRLGMVSRLQMGQVKLYYQKRTELTQQLLQQPTDEQICDYMGITTQELSKIYLDLHYLSMDSLEKVIFQTEGEEISLKETLTHEEESVLIKLEKRDQFDELAKAIEKLNQREQYILQFYYVEELSLQQIGEILNLSTTRIYQLHGRAIASLRLILERG